MKVLITHSYFMRHDPKQWKQQKPYPPLGTLQAVAVLRQQGFAVNFFDTMFSYSAEEIIPALNKIQPNVFVICDDGFNYLTKMCLTNMRHLAFRMSALAKERGCTVIVSSSDATDHSKEYFDNGADFVIHGETEETLLELVTKLSKQENYDSTKGLFFQNGSLVKTPHREVLRDLDSLPLPAWDLLDVSPYKTAWKNSSGYFSINLNTTRGCPFKCNWCAKPIYGNRYNSRSPQHVVKEMKWLKELFGYDHIWFCDDIFGLKPGWVHSFAAEVEKEKIKTPFKIQCRVDLMLQENYVADLARAGCEEVWAGAESGSQKILDAMDKGTTVEQIYEATALMRKHNIRPAFFLQFGYPGETQEDIDKTINMVLDLMPDDIGVSVSYPLPGTKFYEKVKEDLKEKSNWTDSDELALMFKNVYPASYYRHLQRYLHKRFRRKQGYFALSHIHRGSHVIKKIAGIAYHYPGQLMHKFRMDRLAKIHASD